MDIETRTIITDIESRILQVANELQSDPNYTKDMAIQELAEIVEHINELKVPIKI